MDAKLCVHVCFNLRKIMASLWTDANNPTFMKRLNQQGCVWNGKTGAEEKESGISLLEF